MLAAAKKLVYQYMNKTVTCQSFPQKTIIIKDWMLLFNVVLNVPVRRFD